MKDSRNLIGLLAVAVAISFAGTAPAQEKPFQFQGATCTAGAPYLHCPDRECSSATVINQGNVVEMKTRRTYFLDYPCDLKKGEKVTFILSLHGAGSYGNRSEEHTSELQSLRHLVCRLLLEKKKE